MEIGWIPSPEAEAEKDRFLKNATTSETTTQPTKSAEIDT